MRWMEKFARPWAIGAVYFVLLALHAVGASDESAATLGAHANAINSFVRTRYATEIFRLGIAIVLVAAVLGAAIGAIAGALVELRDRVAEENRSRTSLAWRALVVTVLIQAWCELVAMASTPALYVDAFYARGGVPRTVQVLATDALGRAGIVLAGLLALALFLAGPRRAWPAWPQRIRTALDKIRAISRQTGARVAAAIAVTAALAFCLPLPRLARAAASQTAKPNVLVLAADSFRFDRLNAK
ncbi:MAG: hypothetical protein ACRELY_23100, partial [Polyangiaceae bacterium]